MAPRLRLGLRRLAFVTGPVVGFLAGALLLRSIEPAPASGPPSRAAEDLSYGVLVMAHGGSPEWNRSVLEACGGLSYVQPTEVAFGMADAASIQDAVARLERKGVRHVGVVRVFISGESWFERTRQILGLSPGAPERPASEAAPAGEDATHAEHGAGAGHRMEFWRIETGASFALHHDGLSEEPGMGEVLASRASDLSRTPAEEDVLVLAHGPEDDGENERWLARMDRMASAVRRARPFRRVEAMTLREDWPEKRAEAERRIRGFVERARAEGGDALVIPFRVHGFGPYAKVLEGLEFRSDGRGLLPHPAVTAWVRRQVDRLRAGPFERPGARPSSAEAAMAEAVAGG